MELRVVQTTPKLILEWDPVPGAVAGYRGRAQGVEKWTQTQATRMTFAANATGIVIQALGVEDEGQYPAIPEPEPEPEPSPDDLLWNGDWETGNKSQYGGTEFGGTFDGVPALSDQLKIMQSDGAVTPLQGKWFAKTIIVPGAQYGNSSGWRCLTRQYDPIRLRGEGYDSWVVFGVRFPPSFTDEWVFMQWHQNGGQWPKPFDFDPGVSDINARVVIDKAGAPGELDQKSYPIPMVKDVWHVFIVRMKFSTTPAGKMQVWHGIKGRDASVTRKVDHSGRTLMNPPADKAHLMFGLYGPQAGTSNRWVYHDAAREYSTEASALAYANSLL